MQEQQDCDRRSFVLAARGKANEGGSVRPHPNCLNLLDRMREGNLQARAIKDAGRWRLTELTLELPNQTNTSTSCRDGRKGE